MANTVTINETYRVYATFYDWDSGSSAILDPTSVEVDILDVNLNRTVEDEVATRESPGRWFYDWTPLATGTYHIEFKGTFSNGQTALVREEFLVEQYQAPTPPSGEAYLPNDYEFQFVTELTPLYIDPEDLLSYYPDATGVEAAEAVHRFSLEVYEILGGATPTPRALDYIRAAALCSLARIYDASMSGMEQTMTLGDLSVSTRAPRSSITNDPTAGSWCEQAAALRKELLRSTGGAGMRVVFKGSNFDNPVPSRILRDRYGTPR